MDQQKYSFHYFPAKLKKFFWGSFVLYFIVSLVIIVSVPIPVNKIESTVLLTFSAIALLALFILLLFGILYLFRKLTEKYLEEIVFSEKSVHSKQFGEIYYEDVVTYKIIDTVGLYNAKIAPSLRIVLQNGKKVEACAYFTL